MKEKILTICFILLIVSLLSIVVFGSKAKKSTRSLIFYYGKTCPHCREVEKWMRENKIEEKVKIVKKEVYDNRTNAEELAKTARACGLDTTAIGVPFLYTPQGRCLIGKPEIISYLSNKVDISDGESTKSGKEIKP